MKSIIQILNNLINGRIMLDDISILAVMLILTIIIIIAENIIYRIIAYWIQSRKFNPKTTKILEKSVSYFLYLIMIILILNILGISEALPAIIASLGFVGLALAFASQTFIQNLIAGFVILIERDLKIGDEIEVGGIRGKIYDIRLRTTRIITEDNVKVIVPNIMLLNTIVKRYVKK
ncbi:MAG: mechanosensitive ion channel family protein [Candidatus Parvarchaeota archaeon]|nr:mechanosensitive ion channel family protein [Candidatus Jingweiarchaeum tengchongense]MCW1298442.1 mechanosensitive ion channel family protein [Candidatus Jingweiarchaeum tengchongense]MCW1300534.1 mechanosensitive ion channel family protein [Candidatus Jingweiarchaeum tengchongense]MCW1304991.1 mechanosensitive ion channel family protein [Candidatus Jingweiarchaeum tengchongense]MCW1306011.1 mechanosensitive ion channel family protein [Candidatus Jingweiarchaeum tengchongense]